MKVNCHALGHPDRFGLRHIAKLDTAALLTQFAVLVQLADTAAAESALAAYRAIVRRCLIQAEVYSLFVVQAGGYTQCLT